MNPTATGRDSSWSRRTAAVLAAAAMVVAACGPNAGVGPTSAPSTAPPMAPSTGPSTAPSDAPSTGIVLPTDPVTLRVAYYNAGGQTEIDYRQAQADAFTSAHPNVTLKMEPIQDWAEVMYPQLAAGTAPDVIWADTDTGYGAVAAKGTYQPLDPFMEQDGFDTSPWSEDVLNHFKDASGKLLLLPNSNLGFNFVYYNKKMFDEAGLPYPSNDWTIDDLLATGRKLTKPDAKAVGPGPRLE